MTEILSPILYRIEDRKRPSVTHHDRLRIYKDRAIPLWMRRKRHHFLLNLEDENLAIFNDLDATVAYDDPLPPPPSQPSTPETCFSCRVAHSTAQKCESLHQRRTCLLMHHGVTCVWVDYLRKALWVLARHFGVPSLEGLLRIVVDRHLYSQYEQPVGSRHQLMMRVWAQTDGLPRASHYDVSPPNHVACLIDRSVIRCMVMEASTCVVEELCNRRIDVPGTRTPDSNRGLCNRQPHTHRPSFPEAAVPKLAGFRGPKRQGIRLPNPA